MAKIFEQALLASTLTEIVEKTISEKNALMPTAPTESALKDILEYEGRMRVSGMDKFNSPSFIAVSNLYLNDADKQRNKPKGAIVVFMNTEFADKIFKALGLAVPYDEDDDSMMKLCGEFTATVVNALTDRLAGAGYVSLLSQAPLVYKNNVSEGVAFSVDQQEKQEITFTYFKNKAIIIEVSLAPIPKK